MGIFCVESLCQSITQHVKEMAGEQAQLRPSPLVHAVCRQELWGLAANLHQNLCKLYHVQTATSQCFILRSVIILSDNV